MSERLFVIIKDGYYWRPNGVGYTENRIEAGFYTEREAKEVCEHPYSRCRYKPVSSVFNTADLDEMEVRIKQARQQIELDKELGL